MNNHPNPILYKRGTPVRHTDGMRGTLCDDARTYDVFAQIETTDGCYQRWLLARIRRDGATAESDEFETLINRGVNDAGH